MPLLPSAVAKQPQINAAVTEVVRELHPDVQRIRYEIQLDWTGQWAIFFRVLLSDEASTGDKLREVARTVIWRMSGRLNLPELGLFPYFDFRSESEQSALNEPEWAATS